MSQNDILQFPAHMDAPAFGGAKYVLTLLDLIPLIFSDLYKAEQPNWRFHFARWLEVRSIKNASKILAISQCTADDAHRILGIPYEKIEVTPLGVDDSFFTQSSQDKTTVQKRYKLNSFDKLILYVGGIDQRKNIEVLLDIFAQVKGKAQKRNGEKVGLVLLGSIRKEKQYPKLCQQCDDLEIVDDVVMPGFVPDEDLIALYQACDLFLFPSLYEGFGFPPLEAMAAGLPVVSSNTSSMPEVLGDAAYYFEPTDVAQGVEAVCQVLFNEEVAAELKEKGCVQARKFTWQQTAEKTLRAYESLV
jgi:glycosyltransferase involved in cell wall biosynthesis